MIQITSREILFALLKKHLPEDPIIIEAGSFNGKDTLRLAAFWPTSIIHAFEPVPEIFDELVRTTRLNNNIIRYPVALSDTNGEKAFFVAEHPKRPGKICQAGSLLKPKDRLNVSPITYPKTMLVKTLTLDTWAKQYGVDHVDFIWLDLQGHELAVLKNGHHTLSTTKALYLEVNFIEAYENQTNYLQCTDWLYQNNFIPVAKDFIDENKWFFGNILWINTQLLYK